VTTSKVRWWQSNFNLGFAGTVVATLVGGVILAQSSQIREWAVAAWHWLVHPVPVPLVVLVVMVGALIVFLWGIVRKSIGPAPPVWLGYRQDNFLEMVWRWRYAGTVLVESSIRPYCPRCGTGLRWGQQGYTEMTTYFNCDECKFSRQIPSGADEVVSRIGRLIEREAERLSQRGP
jgi:hypothetical protein